MNRVKCQSLSLAPNTPSAPELSGDACYLKQTALLASHDHLFIWVMWGQQPGDVRQKQGFRKVAFFSETVVPYRSLKMAKQNFLSARVSPVGEWTQLGWEIPTRGV